MEAGRKPRSLLKWLGLVAAGMLVLALLGTIGSGAWLAHRLAASLPQLEGEVRLPGLAGPVVVERDGLGVPTIRGSTRMDIARATGFLHAEERFFQMDLLRRSAAGELAALAGPALVPADRAVRVHRFRAAAVSVLSQLAAEDRELIAAYTEGARTGLAALAAPPPEYVLLRVQPEPWQPEDTVLVVMAMYLTLQDSDGSRESDLGLMRDVLPPEMVEFLAPQGTEWDAPIDGLPQPVPTIPPPEVYDLRRMAAAVRRTAAAARDAGAAAGSNAWAVAGTHAAHGTALVANDIHLDLGLPNIWYRASFVWPDEDGSGERQVTGITLPGAPAIVAGSNGRVAWGFTNSYVDLSDLVLLEPDPAGGERYLTPEGPREIEHHDEIIRVKGGADQHADVQWTVWGPLIDGDHRGRRRALRWVAHDPAAVDLGLVRLERAHDLDQALAAVAGTSIPTQNCVLADASGRIGWTLIGPVPRRFGFDGRFPESWASGTLGWNGWLAVEDRPQIIDPPEGRIWSANQRMVGGTRLTRVGDGGYALGARARQIRDRLRELEGATERDLLALQLDDRALLIERWRSLLLSALTDEAIRDNPRRAELRRIVERDWDGRASTPSAGYRMARSFRSVLGRQVLDAVVAPCRAESPDFSLVRLFQSEGPAWALLTERPAHLLDPHFTTWDEQILAAVDQLLDQLLTKDQDPSTLAKRSWGELNTVRIAHPLSRAVPQLARWLDIPPEPLPGDVYCPRVQGPTFGASMRMVVSPGHEERGLFHMPGGQSGHPRSPYYVLGHKAWARGEAAPFLPGPTVYRLTLRP